MTEGAERTERGREVLRSLLYEYNEHPSERPRILREIHRRFDREHALLIMDAAGFSRTVKAVGIVHVLALLERLERIVRPQVEAHRGRILAGIGFGTVLAIGEDDVYGDEMNLASKLGEDLARPEEVLLTPAAHAALAGTDTFTFQEVGVTISGLESPAYRLALADGPS
jgi:adenylate cyclase